VTLWLSGNRITADRLNDTAPDDTTTSGLVAASGYSVLSFQGRKRLGVVYINALITNVSATVAAVSNTENLTGPEPTIGTLPAGWRPPEVNGAAWDNGTVNGQLVANTDGTIVLRTISYNQSIGTSTNIRFSMSWIGS
jgi:hypothetical protein